MALTACSSTSTVYRVPPLNASDQQRLSCADYPEIRDALRELPAHVFLSGANGEPVIVDGERYVRFSVVNDREAVVIRFADITGRTAHFSCKDNLQWLGDVYTGLEG